MDLQKGNIECTNPDCEKTFTWVYQTLTRNKATEPTYVVDKIYEPEKNEAMVSGGNFRCYCPKCGTPNFLDSDVITSS